MKREIPFVFRESMENLLLKYAGLLNVEIENSRSIRLTEKKDHESNFYFGVRFVKEEGVITYYVNHRPTSLEEPGQVLHQRQSIDSVSEHLNRWLELTKKYNSPSPIFDDPITQYYYDDISSKVKIIDENADKLPFNHEQQTLIIDLYDKMKEQIIKERNDGNSKMADVLLLEIDNAQASLSSEPKNETIEKLYRIAAMGMKYSYYIGKLIAETWVVGKVLSLITGS